MLYAFLLQYHHLHHHRIHDHRSINEIIHSSPKISNNITSTYTHHCIYICVKYQKKSGVNNNADKKGLINRSNCTVKRADMHHLLLPRHYATLCFSSPTTGPVQFSLSFRLHKYHTSTYIPMHLFILNSDDDPVALLEVTEHFTCF